MAALLAALVLPGAAARNPATTARTTAATCGTTNLALNKTATASSTESGAYPASDAVDGNTGTRWSSAFSDPQWLEVDLGSSQSICSVTLNWEA
ncbi:MAG TPA: discoidin domain-containing protein, partial [Streptosporangiaceae bacterium]